MDKLGIDENAQDFSLARDRSRRSKPEKKIDRLSALQKLKQAKATGEKYRAEIFEEKNIYEEVDENEYSKIVKRRQDDDWIVDDGTGLYVEDGREIFEDDDNLEIPKNKKSKQMTTLKTNKNANIRPNDSKPSNIKSMFAAAAIKPRKIEKEGNLDDDALLGDIMLELKQGKSSQILMPTPVRLKKKSYTSVFKTPDSSKLSADEEKYIRLNKDFERKSLLQNTESPQDPIYNDLTNNKHDKINSDKIKPLNNDSIKKDFNINDLFQNEPFTNEHIIAEANKSQSNKKDLNTNNHIKFEQVKNEIVNDDLIRNDLIKDELTKKEPFKNESFKNESIKCESDYSEINAFNATSLDCSQVKLGLDVEGAPVFKMYWLDAFEDYFKHPGVVYLFGKSWVESVKSYVSVCVVVKNIERRIFILPRSKKFNLKSNLPTEEPVSFIDVYNEFDKMIAEPRNILLFKSRKITKSYAFTFEDVPAECEYLEVRYPADLPMIPGETKGTTFSHIFGTNTSCLELFLLDRKLKGPCWIDIKLPKIIPSTSSWCKIELIVDQVENINVADEQKLAPPLVVMSMAFKTNMSKGNFAEILAVSCSINSNYCLDKMTKNKSDYLHEFTMITKPKDSIFPYDFKTKFKKKYEDKKVEVVAVERELLSLLVAKFAMFDPDVVVGHDLTGIGLEVALNKIFFHKIGNWSRIGRLKRSIFPKGTFRSSVVFCGRLLSDIMTSSKELIRCRSYDLGELVSFILKTKREISDIDITEIYNSSLNLLQMIEETRMDSGFIMGILNELNVLPLALQLTNICGNTLAKTLLGGRSERNEYLLLHAFTAKGFIVPDKCLNKKNSLQEFENFADENEIDMHNVSRKGKKKKAAYLGGLVLEPKKGFYDHFILLLDFNSLYPSIIQEYNICFTTISLLDDGQEQLVDEIQMALNNKEVGILPTEIRKLVQSRKTIRTMMKTMDLSQDQMMQYDIRQKALKLTANSMYGCLGFVNSRFYAKKIASIITAKGREILLKTKDLVQAMNLDVIYGDTDSIMVNTGLNDIDEVYKMGNKIKTEVNKLYRLLEIDIDGIFKSMLLLKKKKYAALSVHKNKDGQLVETQELKGLDIVRRDWCELAKDAGQFVVSEILSGKMRDQIIDSIHSKLIEVGQKVNEGLIPNELFYITKQLTKNPEDYPDKNSQPHVQVALRLNASGNYKLKSGDIVYYVICQDGSNLPAMQRAYHPDELTKNDKITIDIKYYLTQQVHPVISRLCDPIDGTDSAQIAECLGLDGTSYRQSIRNRDLTEETEFLSSLIPEVEKYKNCDKLIIDCRECGQKNIVDSTFRNINGSQILFLTKCCNENCSATPLTAIHLIKNKLISTIRAHIKKYYEGWMICEDVACHHRTRFIPLNMQGSAPLCPACSRSILYQEFSEKMLYMQLCFFESIFNVDKFLSKITDSSTKDAILNSLDEESILYYESLRHITLSFIQQNSYSEVNLSKLFINK